MRVFFFIAITLLASVVTAKAPPGDAQQSAAQDHVQATLIVDSKSGRAGIHFKMIPDWHIYWINSGESGLGTRVSFSGGEFGQPQFEVPTVFLDPSGTIHTFGYEKETVVWAEFSDAEVIDAKASFLVCKVECIPGKVALRRVVNSETTVEEIALLAQAADRTPTDVKVPTEVSVVSPVKSGELAKITVDVSCDCEPAPSGGTPYRFFSASDEIALWQTDSAEITDKGFRLELSGKVAPDHGPCRLRGVMPLTRSAIAPFSGVWLDSEFDCSGASSVADVDQERGADGERSLLWMLLFALLGGAILNLMPCVFPVLALKVASLVKLSEHSAAERLLRGALYGVGIQIAFLALAAVVVAVRASGQTIGWGFQFQSPVFVTVMFLVMIVFAANLFGAFEVVVSVSRKTEKSGGMGEAIGEGMLAVILATPCSAPLLGSAVGFAFTTTALQTFLIFAFIGLGLAAPFVLMTAVPGLVSRLPEPGGWMVRLKQGLGICLLGTAVWLGWVLYRMSALAGVFIAIGVAAVALVAAVAYGRTQFSSNARWGKIGVLICVAVVVAVLSVVQFPKAPIDLGDGWEEWSQQRVDALQSDGAIVFVDFTADWCITCKVNENGVLVSEAVEAAFREHQVVKLKADWTHRDADITEALQTRGKAGVPLYLVVGDSELILPELLTESMVVDAVEAARQISR